MTTSTFTSFPQALHRLRLRAGFRNQTQLALHVGVHRATVSRWETECDAGQVRRPSRSKLRELAVVLAQGLEKKRDKQKMTQDQIQVLFHNLIAQEQDQMMPPEKAAS